MSEPVAVAVHLQDMDVMREAVEECAGQSLGAEHAGPFVERQVAGDQRAATLVALREDLKQQLGAGRRQRHVTELVDDQQLVGRELTLEPQQPLLVTGFGAIAMIVLAADDLMKRRVPRPPL
jgi:hypothetical protein